MRILCPVWRAAGLSALSARIPPSQTAAAASKVVSTGTCATAAPSAMQTNSACVPNFHGLMPNTRSPTSNLVTARPVVSTTPARSLPRMRLLGRRRPVKKRDTNSSALRIPVSVRLTVAAWILTSTSSSLGTGRSTSSMCRTSGGPYLSKTTALMKLLSPPVRTCHGRGTVRGCSAIDGVSLLRMSGDYQSLLPDVLEVVRAGIGDVVQALRHATAPG
jgi:hypothetical protein